MHDPMMTAHEEMTGASRDAVAYDGFLAAIQSRFGANLAAGPMFTTDAEGLFDAYLAALPDDRQYHTCHSCQRFIDGFGGLVVIDAEGRTRPAVWDVQDAPEFFREAIAAVAKIVGRAKVTGPFLSTAETWGAPVTGAWHHYAVKPPAAIIFRRVLLTAGQAMAEKREDYRNVQRALAEFTPPTVKQAMRLLESETLYRSEKVIGPAKWLLDLHAARDGAKGPARDNLVWRAVATAPAGFCHPRSSMVGTLLDDIAGGMEFGEVSRRFAAKMHPLQYQRPQAAPSAGNIAQAEKVVAELGATGSLARRFARLDEVEALWRPKPQAPPVEGGVFSHLKPKGPASAGNILPPPIAMTWEKFQRTILPTATAIEFYAASKSDSYSSLVTAVNPDAPPIIQWDLPERRNPVSWYFWHGGSTPESFGLGSGRFHKVNAVCLKPSMWGGGFAHQGEAVFFIVDGAKDSRMAGAAIFPEILKSEFHGIRSTIEAYSRSATIEGMEQASAAGIALSKGGRWDARFRVHQADGAYLDYKLDRWD